MINKPTKDTNGVIWLNNSEFGDLWGYIWRKNVLRSQNLLQNKILWLNWSFPPKYKYFSSQNNQILTFPFNWAHNYLYMGSGLLNWPIVGMVVEQINYSKSKLTQISHISIKIQVPQNDFKSELLDYLDIDYQMLGTCGQ